MKIEIKKIGNSDGLILPKELLARLRLDKGDWVYVTELSDRSIKITPYDPAHEKGMEIAEEIMDEYRDTLAALAK